MKERNHWHPVMLPDDYIQKQRWALAQMEAWIDSRTRCVPDPESYNVESYNVALFADDDEADDVTPFPAYDADPPPPESYCQLPADDPSP